MCLEEKAEVVNMCKAWENSMNQARNEGISQGISQGRMEAFQQMADLGFLTREQLETICQGNPMPEIRFPKG